ncbi:hypothetical protein TWF281_003819 [Arthrobotrys megalospora]
MLEPRPAYHISRTKSKATIMSSIHVYKPVIPSPFLNISSTAITTTIQRAIQRSLNTSSTQKDQSIRLYSQIKMHFQLPVVALIAAMANSASAAWFAFYHDTGYSLVVKDGNPNCKGTCLPFTSSAVSAKLYGSSGKFTSCSVYQSGDCSGGYITLYSDKNTSEKAYQLGGSYNSARCYYNC